MENIQLKYGATQRELRQVAVHRYRTTRICRWPDFESCRCLSRVCSQHRERRGPHSRLLRQGVICDLSRVAYPFSSLRRVVRPQQIKRFQENKNDRKGSGRLEAEWE